VFNRSPLASSPRTSLALIVVPPMVFFALLLLDGVIASNAGADQTDPIRQCPSGSLPVIVNNNTTRCKANNIDPVVLNSCLPTQLTLTEFDDGTFYCLHTLAANCQDPAVLDDGRCADSVKGVDDYSSYASYPSEMGPSQTELGPVRQCPNGTTAVIVANGDTRCKPNNGAFVTLERCAPTQEILRENPDGTFFCVNTTAPLCPDFAVLDDGYCANVIAASGPTAPVTVSPAAPAPPTTSFTQPIVAPAVVVQGTAVQTAPTTTTYGFGTSLPTTGTAQGTTSAKLAHTGAETNTLLYAGLSMIAGGAVLMGNRRREIDAARI